MRRHSAPFRILSISRKQSARYCASADKLGNGAGNGLRLLQQQKVSRTRQVDNPDALAALLAERVAIARRSRFIIEPLDHEKRGCSGTPPIFERHTPAGREVETVHGYMHFRHQLYGLWCYASEIKLQSAVTIASVGAGASYAF